MSKRNPAWGKSYSPVGRVNRKEYLISSVCLAVYMGLLFGAGSATSTFVAATWGIFSGTAVAGLFILLILYLYWQYIMLCVKRWHDLNLPGWLCLLTFAFSIFPIFASPIFVIFTLFKKIALFFCCTILTIIIIIWKILMLINFLYIFKIFISFG